ncbi:hypothetical protein LUZ62_050227 [Rhynchospora pubera]|uniref:Uncharacterized protein n=1 Tax=Rhynchospora pubera TaxID=906938 RepID=A0AAV8G5D2_9POAL|nr:hypothetical protein LUZ62_050227 [Rhynchospora pubera]
MAKPIFSLLLFFPFLLLLLPYAISTSPSCTKNTTFSGFVADFFMIQHQLRGTLEIIDGCSFSVSRFDMLPGSESVTFYGAPAPDLDNMTTLGRTISSFPLNDTFSNATLTAHLLPNETWDDIGVLAVWDPVTASDFGHVLLSQSINQSDPDSNSDLVDANRTVQPTMFANCLRISDRYRLRWTLNTNSNSIDIGLEAAIGSEFYMAFGWADPTMTEHPMLHADVSVTGFTEEGMPFAEDYFITKYSECLLNKDGTVSGVCPDTIYEGSDPVGFVNNSKLVYGHRRDGVSFIRYQKPLVSVDKKYDVEVDVNKNMTVIWALGLMRPPDALRPYYLPQNHGGAKQTTYGFLTLNVSEPIDMCPGPLDADDKEDQDKVIAERNTPLVVTSGPAFHYPNPPNPSKVLYINKKEAPFVQVERGVPVTFSVQAGHDVSLYITSDRIGGNATLRNKSEVIYAGGPDTHGVVANPYELTWLPDRNTPDQVYYHSLYEQKMGWRISVVDGGLSDMYNNSVLLDDQQVTLFWTLSEDSISFAARGEKKSGYIAIGFGPGMINSYAYVGWVDKNGTGRVNTYWIDGKDAMSIHPTAENLTYVRCSSEGGIITFEFTRPLNPLCKGRVECKNIIDPTTPLKVVWAMGAQWSGEGLTVRNMHSVTSSRLVRVLLLRGSAEAEQDLRPVLAVHGFMMFVAWGFLLPGGVLAARYLKHLKGDGWFQTHVYLQYSGIAIMMLGLLFAAAELKGFYLSSVHVKFGVTALVLASLQPLNAYMRPKKPETGEVPSFKRVIWEYLHIYTGRGAIVAGTVALFTGMKHLGHRYGDDNVKGLTWALICWILAGVGLVIYLEFNEHKQRRANRSSLSGNWVLGNTSEEEDDSADLLGTNHATRSKSELDSSSVVMEVQLEPLTR